MLSFDRIPQTITNTTKRELFSKLHINAALDKRLTKTTSNLYMKMLGLAAKSDFSTMTFSATISDLAEAINMSTRVRRHLPKIIMFGYVEVYRHKSGRKLNMPNTYVMVNQGSPYCSEKAQKLVKKYQLLTKLSQLWDKIATQNL